ncbi:MAG: hypothetical protein HOP26_09785 [Methylotenera sp.]|nr:hypothetical protein [Methylotenera sp.]
MDQIKKLLELIKSPGLMAVLAILGFALAIYATWFYEKRPEITYEVLSNSKVLDVHTSVSKLDILYGGESLKSQNLELNLVVVRIKNTGSIDLSKNDFDDVEPLGLKIVNGRLLEEPSVSSSSRYLERNVKILRDNGGQLNIAPILFDVGEWIKMQLLVATPTGTSAIIQPSGKVSGIKSLLLSINIDNQSDVSFWKKVTEADSVWVHIVRFPVYLILGVFCFAAIVGTGLLLILAPIIYFSDRKDRVRNKKIAREYSFSRNLTIADQVVLEVFQNSGVGGVRHIGLFIKQAEYRNKILTSIKGLVDEKLRESILRYYLVIQAPFHIVDSGENALITFEEDGLIHINSDVNRALSDFKSYLCAKGEYKELESEEVAGEDLFWTSESDGD